MVETEEILKILSDVADGLELMSRQIRAGIAKIIEERSRNEGWKVVHAPSPVDPNDRALKWLVEKCLPEVAKKHNDIRWEVIRGSDGKITAVRYFCQDREVEDDIIKPTQWAFEVAKGRSQSSPNK